MPSSPGPAFRLLAVFLVPWFASSAWSSDVAGSADPLGLARVPDSWIVGYERDDQLKRREYALGRVDKTRRDVRIEHEVRAAAAREWATYEMPTGTQREQFEFVQRVYTEAQKKLRRVVGGDLVTLEEELEALGAPWTPGRVPRWSPE